MPKRKHRQEPEEVVPGATAEHLQKTVQAAKTLASIPDQELLENPALNPATRSRYDELTAARLQEELDLYHRRRLRDAHEQDRREGEQAETAAAIAAARKATSPAKTVLDMTRHQRTFGRIVLAASLALSVGSAMGMEALVQKVNGPTGVGYLAEVGLTGLSTTVIVWAGILARSGTKIEKTTARLFAVLIGGPLLVSIVGSVLGSGPVGAACSIGSALFAALAYLITTTSSDAIGQALTRIDRLEATHRTPSTTPAAVPGRPLPRRNATPGNDPADTGGIGEATARWLAEITEAGDHRTETAAPASATPGSQGDHPLAEDAATPAEQDALPPLEGNRLTVWEAICQHGVGVSNRRLAEVTGLARGTVRTHRTALWRDGYAVFDPDTVNDS